MRYAFEIRDPLINPVILAMWVDAQRNTEHLWVGTDIEVGIALRAPNDNIYFAQSRPLGAFWCEFAKSWDTAWTDAIWALSRSLEAWRRKRGMRKEMLPGICSRKLTEENKENAAVWYAADPDLGVYLRCRRGRNGKYARNFSGNMRNW